MPLFSLALCLAACGGGGSGGSPTPPPTATPNTAPTFTSAASVQRTENDPLAVAVTATDAQGDTIAISISGGADAALFSLNAQNVLSFRAAPNFELPRDADGNNVYEVQLRASDSSASTVQALSIEVTNDREGIRVRRIGGGLVDVTAIASIPGDDDVFVGQRNGRILRVDPVAGSVTEVRQLLNVNTTGQRGLLGLAASPGFAGDGLIWAVVAKPIGQFLRDQGIELCRFRLANVELPGGCGGPLEFATDATERLGGWVGFDQNGLLYLAFGDGGNEANSQDSSTLLGKVLRMRLNPDPNAGAAPIVFGGVDGNPFFPGSSPRAFIFVQGVRDPAPGSFLGTDLFIGDRGAGRFEEVNRLMQASGGANLGWPFFEASRERMGGAGFTQRAPVTEYPFGTGPREGQRIGGGVAYQGPITELQGKYVFFDSATGNIWSLPVSALSNTALFPAAEYERRNADFTPAGATIGRITAMGSDSTGNIYLVDDAGGIFIVDRG